MNIYKFYLILSALLFLTVKVDATHLRGGEITVTRPDCGSLTHFITITVYLDSDSSVPFGGGTLDFGDGSDPVIVPEVSKDPRPDLGPDVATASYTITHTYASAGAFLITYTEPNRNADIKNIPNSVNTRFHIETLVVVDPSVGCNSSPVLLIPPIDRGCGGVTFYHNPGAFDPDGDSLSYEIVVPKSGPGIIISGYNFPADPPLYASGENNYATGNEERTGPPFFNINPITGLLTWNAPPIPQVSAGVQEGEGEEYNVAFIVREWRKLYGRWIPLGFVRRDMQIIIEKCENDKPELIVPDDICVEAGTVINEEIIGIDPNQDSVKIEVFSQTLLLEGSPATYQPADNPFQFISNEVQGKVDFHWETTCDHVRDQPYQVVFKITDKGSPRLVNFATWNITVIGPSPEITEVTNIGRALNVTWDPYFCENADIMQVWRKVDSNPFEPDSCETGMREGSGYRQIAELPITANSYLDNNLAMGAKYCYRLVAVFRDNINAESKVSNEMCFEFVPAEAPVITNVSIERTSPDNGEIRVSWKKPYDLDPSYTGNFFYDIYRARGLTGTNNISLAGTIVNDTTFLDKNLNTEDNTYNYRIVLRVPEGPIGNEPVDTSAVASSVRLEPMPEFDRIEISWEAEVPWSNVIASGEGEYHYIFRGNDGAQTVNDLTIIDSVRVVESGFVYVDSGQYNNQALKNDQFYCYAVMTRGTYGNPRIASPLDNLSQITCVQPVDTIAPCSPKFTLQGIDCQNYVEQFGCNFNEFRNELTWSRDGTFTCEDDDIRVYEIFYAATTADDYVKIAETRDTTYTDNPEDNSLLTSFKGCYKVRAIDRSGNISEFSNEFCFDNCPNYELPNVITPNNDGCNDQLVAYNNPAIYDGPNPNMGCGDIDISRCARFVISVDFTVFNRWGKEVYHYNSLEFVRNQNNTDATSPVDPERAKLINWKGVDKNGNQLPPGVYYYLARVHFDVVNPEEALKDIKGWVHIFR